MGDTAEMHLDGTLCVCCGCLMEDLIQGGTDELKEPPGYPRYCEDCQPACLRCKNSEISPGDNFCKICGLSLKVR